MKKFMAGTLVAFGLAFSAPAMATPTAAPDPLAAAQTETMVTPARAGRHHSNRGRHRGWSMGNRGRHLGWGRGRGHGRR